MTLQPHRAVSVAWLGKRPLCVAAPDGRADYDAAQLAAEQRRTAPHPRAVLAAEPETPAEPSPEAAPVVAPPRPTHPVAWLFVGLALLVFVASLLQQWHDGGTGLRDGVSVLARDR